MKKILIVEDDIKLAGELKIFLESKGHRADILQSFEDTANAVTGADTDIVLLDINLPVSDGRKATGIGLYLCCKLCEKMNVGIHVQSQEGAGTSVSLVFPKGSFVQI